MIRFPLECAGLACPESRRAAAFTVSTKSQIESPTQTRHSACPDLRGERTPRSEDLRLFSRLPRKESLSFPAKNDMSSRVQRGICFFPFLSLRCDSNVLEGAACSFFERGLLLSSVTTLLLFAFSRFASAILFFPALALHPFTIWRIACL